MPTILTHPAVPFAIALGLGRKAIPPRLLAAGVVASIVPDADVVGFSLGVSYGSEFGHRGFTHSIPFAAALALVGVALFRAWQVPRARAFWFLFIAAASHGVLDAFTTGGSGIAFLWPWLHERYFAPIQVIEVSPIGVARFISARGATVLASELLWIWLPCALTAAVLALVWRALPALSSRRNETSQRD